MKERELYEKVINKGAHNGDTIVADPVAKTATLPNSKNNAEPMNKIQDPNHPGIEDTDSATNTKQTADKSASNKASIAMKEEAGEDNVTASVAGHKLTLHRHLSEPGEDTFTLHSASGPKKVKITTKSHGDGEEVHGEKVNKAFGLSADHQLGHKVAKSMNGMQGGISKFEEGYMPSEYSIEVAFEGEELTEEFKEKAATIFEAAVSAKVNAAVATLEEQYAQQVQEQVETFKQELTEQLDKYLDYIVEQWMETNEIAIEQSLRSEITEEFIDGLRTLFAEHYIEVPEDKLDVLEDLTNKVQELEQKLDESITANIELNDAIKEYSKNEILAQVAEGLTLTQKEKFSTLAEGVEFTDEKTYAKKLEIVKENYFKSSTKTSKSITETEVELAEEAAPDKPVYHGTVAKYMQAISRTTAKK